MIKPIELFQQVGPFQEVQPMVSSSPPHPPLPPGPEGQAGRADRRRFLTVVSAGAMGGGLVSSYGTLAALAVRFLYPARPREAEWQFVATIDQLPMGKALHYIAPAGYPIVIARQSDGVDAEAFIALSSICPHLGCQVHWEPQNDRFFCPCHNGAFDPKGRAIAGPPAKEGQQLVRFPLKVAQGALFIQAPTESVTG